MSLTLLVENNPKIESFYKLNLATWLGLETVSHKKGDEALQYLEKNHEQVSLLIVRARIDKEQTAKFLIEYMKIRNLTIPMIIIGAGDFPGQIQVANSLDLKILIKSAAAALNITAKEMITKVVPDFFPIAIDLFHYLRRSVCPVFTADPQNPRRYLPCIEKIKDFDQAQIKALESSGVTTLFVNKMDRLAFVGNLTSEIIATLKDEELSDDEQITAVDKGVELLSKKLLSLGVTEETITLAKKNMESIRSNVRKNPKISKLMDRLLSNKTSYLYKHTQILTYVSLHIIRNIDWGTPEQEDKISFISFFHDIALESDAQAMIKSTLELKKAEISPEARILVEKHAQLSAEFASKFPHAPMGSDQIIRQHHGQLNGIGFSDHFGANVSPISIVFIVAEEFTRIIMARETGPFEKEDMLRELKEQFPTSRFAKIIDKLQTVTF